MHCWAPNTCAGSKRRLKWNTAQAYSLLGHCLFLSLVGLIPSEIIVHLSGRTSAKSVYFLLSGEWLCEKMQFPCFQRQDSLWQRNGMLWGSRSRLSHPLCFLSLSFCVYLPLHNSQILDSLVPVSVSRTFAFSRGDSLAGSPGKHAWGLDLHRSMGFIRGLWCLPLFCMKTSLSQQTGPGRRHSTMHC